MEVGWQDSSEVPDAVDLEPCGWRNCGVYARAAADREAEANW